MISLTHFNDNYPELQNIYFVNLKDDIGYVFEDSKFIPINKSEVLNVSIDNKFKKNFEKFYSQDRFFQIQLIKYYFMKTNKKNIYFFYLFNSSI